jgi:hypothetical protein
MREGVGIVLSSDANRCDTGVCTGIRMGGGNGYEPLRHGPNPATTSKTCRRSRPLRFDLWDATDDAFHHLVAVYVYYG